MYMQIGTEKIIKDRTDYLNDSIEIGDGSNELKAESVVVFKIDELATDVKGLLEVLRFMSNDMRVLELSSAAVRFAPSELRAFLKVYSTIQSEFKLKKVGNKLRGRPKGLSPATRSLIAYEIKNNSSVAVAELARKFDVSRPTIYAYFPELRFRSVSINHE